MPVTLEPGQTKEVDVQLTPIGVEEPITIDELFIGTNRYSYTNQAEYGAYVRLKNSGATQLSGTVKLYDWQGHSERPVATRNFTIPPGDVSRHWWMQWMTDDVWGYIRVEVQIGQIIVIDTGPVHFIPGKIYMGAEVKAVGECVRSDPGSAILWYSQYSVCELWEGSYRTPPQGQGTAIHLRRFKYRAKDYHNQRWAAVFLPMFDSDFISGARYEAYITGSPNPHQVRFEWTQA